jgi:hypothetical protein
MSVVSQPRSRGARTDVTVGEVVVVLGVLAMGGAIAGALAGPDCVFRLGIMPEA